MFQATNALQIIQIASPCSASWEEMQGDERVRFCAHCRLNVYNLSDMPRAEAEALIAEREGQLCVRFYRRRDGTVLTQDCPVGLRAAGRRVLRFAATLTAILAAALGWATLMRGSGEPGGAKSPWRQLEPFATILEWLAPSPPPPLMGIPAFPMPPAPPPQPDGP
jgi:hypothetical protein